MASISVPCPKCALTPRPSGASRSSVVVPASRRGLLSGSPRLPLFQVSSRNQYPILKAQVKEVAIESSSNSSTTPSTKVETLPSNGKGPEIAKESTGEAVLSDSAISAFMAEISDLVKLVDSRDITELQLKQKDCELIIRKKEALQQPAPAPPGVMMHPQQMAFAPPTPLPHAVPSSAPAAVPTPAPTPALALPAKGRSNSSLPPLKCPMAGTFYRSPAPGEPPFVKVGDKVKKGQVVCIIEAMKLMNEIEADKSGTIVDILAEDGKPVSVDLPLLVIEP